MSLNRLALRLATVLALSNNNSAPWPTMAEGRVYDSRLDPVEMLETADRKALIIVYTDGDKGTPQGAGSSDGVTGFTRTIDLVIEMAVAQPMLDEGTDPGLVALQTDSQLEATLDAFEMQIKNALRGPAPWAVQWKTLTRRIRTWDSARFAETDASRIRFSERRIVIEVEMADDCTPRVMAATNAPGQPLTPPPDPVLPPAIANLVAAVTATGTSNAYVAGVLAVLTGAANLTTPLMLPALRHIRFKERDRGGGLRPDGVADIETEPA